MKKILMFISILVMILFMISCGVNSNDNTIVASSFPIYDLTKRVVGDKYNVSCFVPNGVEPHHFEPTPSKVAELESCILYVENGLGFEHYTLPEKISSKKVTLSTGVDIIYSSKDEKTVDPHIWLSPINAIKMMENLLVKLIEINPLNEDYFKKNFQKNRILFEALDQKYKQELSNLRSKYLVTTHEAFGYLCKEYGLSQIALMGVSTEDKPTAMQIVDIQTQIADLNVTTIFSEELASEDFAKDISDTLGINCDILNTIEGLTDETLADDYLTLMADNLLRIRKALQ